MKKLALIGCGGIGKYHLSHFVNFKDIELAGFCDLIIERAEEFVKIAGSGKAFSDFEKMYDEINPDMVFICIPPSCHGYIEFETIRRGIPFFVEKPIALDIELAKNILNKIEQKGLITAVGFQCRYDNINDAARSYIEKNRIIQVQGSRIGGIPTVPWWRIKSLSGGMLVEATIHQMDLLRYFLGEPDTVYSIATKGFITEEKCKNYDTDDLSVSVIKFKNGTTATMSSGCYSENGASWESKMTFGSFSSRMDYKLCSDVTICGIDASDRAEKTAGGVISGDGMQKNNPNEKGIKITSDIDFGTICDRTFVDAVLTGDASKIRSPYSDAFKSVAFTLACNKSMETGLPVKIEY